MLRPRTLVWRLGLALMAMQAVVAVVVGVYALSALSRSHDEWTTRHLEQVATLVADELGAAFEAGAATGVQRRAGELAGELGLRVTAITAAGEVIADSANDPQQMDDHRYRPEVDEALRRGSGTSARYSATLGIEMLYAARAVEAGGRPIGVVRVAAPAAAVRAERAGLARQVALAGLAGLALTLVLIYVASRNIGLSVTRLARGALRFAAGDLGHRIPRPPSSELARVAAAFNRMAEQLEQRIEQLRAQQSEQQIILQSMSNGVIALDAEQRILSANRAAERLLDLEGRAARGRLLHELVRAPDLHRFVEVAMAAPGSTTDELTIGHDVSRIIQTTAEPLEGAEGEVGLLIVLNDVTQLRRLETIRSDFAANVSHELKTPITAIKGYIETLLGTTKGLGPDQQRFLRIIGRNADRLAAIVEDLLALARLEEPETSRTLERDETPVAVLIDSVVALHRAAATQKSVRIVTDAPADLRARINARLVEQALANLVSNAVKFSPASTTVRVRGARSDGDVVIAVTDEGPGIDPEHRSRLFERFYRVDRARSRELGGTGLGLAIVKHIAMVHGGRVEVESAPGRGSEFRIIIPARLGAATETEPVVR